MTATPNDGALAFNARGMAPSNPPGNVLGLANTSARASFGAISLSRSSHLVPDDGSKFVNPVELPPGLVMLSTKPLPAGSCTVTNTLGTFGTACRIAAVAGEAWVRTISAP